MVETPWGPSESLRERRLRPGPGTPPEDVARNQRARLFGAMVASVSERGYAATRLSDLAEISGVARTSFYQHFDDKEACFVAAAEEILAVAVRAMTVPADSWAEQVRQSTKTFAELIVGQPAAARMCLIEVHAVGPAGLRVLEQATAQVEAHALRSALDSSEDKAALQPMIAAHIGALRGVAQTRLRNNCEETLPELMGEFSDLVLSYRAPPVPLRLRARRPRPAPETLDAHDHAERALRALTLVATEQGYANTTIEQVLKRASMSPTTFYSSFRDKEEALMVAIDRGAAQMLAAILPVFQRNPEWTHGARAAFGALFNFLASRPALARLMMVEVYAAGPAAIERREQALRPLEVVLAQGFASSPQVPAIAGEAISSGAYALAYRRIRESGPENLPGLAPLCTYLALAPFVGSEEAAVVANSDGRARGVRGSGALQRPLGERILLYLSGRRGGGAEVAEYLGEPVEEVRAALAELSRAGLIEEVRGEGEPTYASGDMGEISTASWQAMDINQRQKISAQILWMIDKNLKRAAEAGTFDARTDRHLTHFHLRLDEQGWRDMGAILNNAFDQVRDVEAESSARQLDRGDGGIEARLILALFEMPDDGKFEA